MTIGEAIRAASVQLRPVSTTPMLDAELLMACVLGCERARLFADGRDPLPPAQADGFDALIRRRANGEPVAYLRGQREFWGLDLRVNGAVLDPRPETELLVEAGLESLRGRVAPRVLDLGAGSGAVALALASERPDAEVLAVERSPAAAAVARDNAQRLDLSRVQVLIGDWMTALTAPGWDLIVSNPPYVAPDDPHLSNLRYEPREALVAADNGYASLQAIIEQAHTRLVPGGCLWLEHGAEQGSRVRERLATAGYAEVRTRRDGAGLERVSGGRAG